MLLVHLQTIVIISFEKAPLAISTDRNDVTNCFISQREWGRSLFHDSKVIRVKYTALQKID